MSEVNEIWKDAVGFEGYYQVSNTGSVYSTRRGRFFKPCVNSSGYYAIVLNVNGVATRKTVHRLVCEAFLSNTGKLPIINHKNGIKTDNRVENLEWCTVSHNHAHACRTGLKYFKCKGEENVHSKLTEKNVLEIRRLLSGGTLTSSAIARKYGVTYWTITEIKYGRLWKHLPHAPGVTRFLKPNQSKSV